MKEGTYVRHRARTEWGVGRIVEVNGDKVRVQFAARSITLSASVAGPHLEELTAAEAADAARAATSTRGTTRAGTGRATPCLMCATPLTRSQRREGDRWKSCPACSVKNGREHLYRLYPDDFGETELHAGESDDSGAQGHCAGCRGGSYGAHTRRCTQLSA